MSSVLIKHIGDKNEWTGCGARPTDVKKQL
jgi:hypothetical protein